jgi:multicomponent Na+:H+ antiporter subunit F
MLLAVFLSFIRFIKGPHLTDRVVAFDTMGIIAVSLLTFLSVVVKSALYLDVALVFALIGFIGTIIFARFNVAKEM